MAQNTVGDLLDKSDIEAATGFSISKDCDEHVFCAAAPLPGRQIVPRGTFRLR